MNKNNSSQTIHILGPGAMGLLWACKLCEDNWGVTLVSKKGSKNNKVTICYSEKNSSIVNSQPKTVKYQVNHIGVTDPIPKLSILLITVKAHQLSAAIKSLIKKKKKSTIIILTQNGLGAETEIYNRFPELNNTLILQTITTHSALRTNSFSVEQTGHGYCWIGNSPKFNPHNPEQPKSAKLYALLGLNLINGWHQNIDLLIWQKLIANASINPLSAILNCRNGELLKKDVIPLLTQIVEECCYIAKHSGLKFNQQRFNKQVMLKKVKQVCLDTANNRSSMLEDVIHHRQTEINYINQNFLNIANKVGIDAPWNLCLTSILNSINRVKID